MSLLVRCPFCPARIEVSTSVAMTTCPKCFKSFDASLHDEVVAARTAKRAPAVKVDDSEPEESAPSWINPWGAGGFLFAALGLVSATAIGSRGLTYTLLGLGVGAVLLGIALAAIQRRSVNSSWLGIGGLANVAALCLVLFAPGLLNRFWGMDGAVPIPDPHMLVAVPRDAQRSAGRLLAPEEWADGVKELVRQNDAQIRLDSVMLGTVPERPGKSVLLVTIRFANVGNEQITFEGFSKVAHSPVLKDASGKTYDFLEQRQRKIGAGAIVYIAAEPQTITLGRARHWDLQLVFEAPPADFSALKLELPASAYSRKGVCKFTISELFVAPLPEVKTK